MKKLILFTLALFAWGLTSAQTGITLEIDSLNGGTINMCGDYFQDSNADPNVSLGNPYGNNENYTTTICPGVSGSFVTIDFIQWGVGTGDILTVYDGNSTAAPILGVFDANNAPGVISANPLINPSGCLTFQWVSDASDVGPGWSSLVSCDPPCQDFSVDINFGAHDTVGTGGFVDACIEDTLVLTAIGTYNNSGTWYDQHDSLTQFVWVLDDTVLFDTSQTFVLPIDTLRGAHKIELFSTDSNGCSPIASNLFIVRIGTGVSYDIAMDDTLVCPLDQQIITSQLSTPTWTNHINPSVSGTLILPDGTSTAPGSYDSDITLNAFPTGSVVTSLTDIPQVKMNIEHSFIGDLTMTLSCPNGSSVILKSFPGGGGTWLGEACDNGTANPGIGWNYYWPLSTPAALTDMTNEADVCGSCQNVPAACGTGTGSTLDSTTYTIVGGANALLGCPLNGTWNLNIVDQWASDDGTLFFWGIDFDPALYSDTVITYSPGVDSTWFTFDSNLVNLDSTNGNLAYFSHNYDDTVVAITYHAVDGFGCYDDSTFTYRVEEYCASSCFQPVAMNFDVDSVQCSTDSSATAVVNGVDVDDLSPYTVSYFDVNYNLIESHGGLVAPLDSMENISQGKYYVEITNQFGCVSLDSFNVLINTDNQLDFFVENTYCVTDSSGLIALDGNVSVPAPYDLTWTDVNGNTLQTSNGLNILSDTLFDLSTGWYYLELESANGCIITDSQEVVLAIQSPLEITITNESCEGDYTGQIEMMMDSIFNGPYSYIVMENLDTITTGTTSNMNHTITGLTSGTYLVEVINGNGCTRNTIVTVAADYQAPSFNLQDVYYACINQPEVIGDNTLPSPFTATWSPAIGLDNPNNPMTIVNIDSSRYYTVTISDGTGCTFKDTTLVSVFQVEKDLDNPVVCFGEEASISATPIDGRAPYNFSWTNNGATIDTGDSISVWPSITETYWAIGTDAQGCVDSVSYLVEVRAATDANFEVDSGFTCDGYVITAFAPSNPDVTEWYLNSELISTSNPVNVPVSTPDEYVLKLVSEAIGGCIDSNEVVLDIPNIAMNYDGEIPNVFTPNGDGYNDYFTLEYDDRISECSSITIFNRWGKLVYQQDGAFKWDGTNKAGKLVATGTYFYIVEIGSTQYKGTVTVMAD